MMCDRTLTTLRLNGSTVADYLDGSGGDPSRAPRPYLHPIRTLNGTPVTDAAPEDHRWHMGLSIALQDVDGGNFWGGPTYLREHGYTWRADHGQIEHAGFTEVGNTGFRQQLRWVAQDGEPLLTETREVRASTGERGWELEITTALTNAAQRPVRLGSPASNGRAGAGYGGLFWRLPQTRNPRVHTELAEGENGTHGSTASWLVWRDHNADFTLVLVRAEGTIADPWFVRVADYPGVGCQLAAHEPVLLSPGETVSRGVRALVVDGSLDESAVGSWAATSRARRADRPEH